MLAAYQDKSAYALCTFAYSPSVDSEQVVLFKGVTNGNIVYPKGAQGFGWDPVFQPDGFDQTYGEIDSETKNKISHRFRALEEMKSYFNM